MLFYKSFFPSLKRVAHGPEALECQHRAAEVQRRQRLVVPKAVGQFRGPARRKKVLPNIEELQSPKAHLAETLDARIKMVVAPRLEHVHRAARL